MTVTMPPPPDRLAAQPVDALRKHYDEVDASALLRTLERDYNIRMWMVPCRLRRKLFHIEFASELSDVQRAILVRYCDGYHPSDMAMYFPELTAEQIGHKIKSMARQAGLISQHQLITFAIYFGVVTPTIVNDEEHHA